MSTKTKDGTPDPPSDDSYLALLKILENHADQIMEHFDTVLILATKHDAPVNVTDRFNVGRGNFYARLGQARTWVRAVESSEVDIGDDWEDDEEDD